MPPPRTPHHLKPVEQVNDVDQHVTTREDPDTWMKEFIRAFSDETDRKSAADLPGVLSRFADRIPQLDLKSLDGNGLRALEDALINELRPAMSTWFGALQLSLAEQDVDVPHGAGLSQAMGRLHDAWALQVSKAGFTAAAQRFFESDPIWELQYLNTFAKAYDTKLSVAGLGAQTILWATAPQSITRGETSPTPETSPLPFQHQAPSAFRQLDAWVKDFQHLTRCSDATFEKIRCIADAWISHLDASDASHTPRALQDRFSGSALVGTEVSLQPSGPTGTGLSKACEAFKELRRPYRQMLCNKLSDLFPGVELPFAAPKSVKKTEYTPCDELMAWVNGFQEKHQCSNKTMVRLRTVTDAWVREIGRASKQGLFHSSMSGPVRLDMSSQEKVFNRLRYKYRKQLSEELTRLFPNVESAVNGSLPI